MPIGSPRPTAGRPAKPREDHIREGTLRPDRHGAEAVREADGKRPAMPQGLSERAKTAWGTLLDDLEASSLLDSADAPLYEAFAVALGRAREARTLITKHGMLVAGRDSQLVANPMLRVEHASLQQVRTLAHELAIGMRARSSLGLAVARGGKRGGADTSGTPEHPSEQGRIGPSPRLRAVPDGDG